jgi:DNA replication protein DnaC
VSAVLTRNLLAQLKLQGMSVALERALKDALEQQWACTEFFNVLLQAEVDFRSERKVKGLIKKAKLPIKARLEDYDFSAKRSLTRPDIKELRDLEWLRAGRPVLLVGPTGVGKSFLGQALSMQGCLAGYSCLFVSITQWLEELAMARATGTYLQWRERFVRPSVLVIDNFGARKLVAMEAQDLCEILDARIGERSTIFTTQLPLEHWAEVLGDPVIADAIRDRLEHMALKLEIKGESYRAVLARRRGKGAAESAEAENPGAGSAPGARRR